jgi:hypothetical protein
MDENGRRLTLFTRPRMITAAVAIAVLAGIAAAGPPSVRADGCDSEETATAECALDEFNALPTPEGGNGIYQSGDPTSRAAPAMSAAASVAPLPPRRTLRIWTDRKSYYVGDLLRVCFRVPGPGHIQIIDIMPDGFRQVLWSWYDDGTGDCQYAYITPPTGTECLVLRYEPRRYDVYPPGPPPMEIVPAASAQAVPVLPLRPRVYYVKTCFQTSGDWWEPIPVDAVPYP